MIETALEHWGEEFVPRNATGARADAPATWALHHVAQQSPKKVHLLQYIDAPLAADLIIPARIDSGRWIVDCPFCEEAQATHPDDPRFFCTTCEMAQAGHKWARVAWPKQRKAIEAEVDKRPAEEIRRWHPEESLNDLRKLNKQLGIST